MLPAGSFGRVDDVMPISKHICALCSVFVLALALLPGAHAASMSARERSLLGAVNDVRSAHNLRPLRVDAKLHGVARAYSGTMLAQNVFTHGAFAQRLAQSGARGPAFGENLAWGVGSHARAGRIVQMWMQSPGHRANLLRPGWTRIGIGVRVGTFQGYGGAAVITADFAGT
jgi:uncharacterized protein YkwD